MTAIHLDPEIRAAQEQLREALDYDAWLVSQVQEQTRVPRWIVGLLLCAVAALLLAAAGWVL